ncbi:hypothetical protein [Flavisphingomonas formosensis]|uniref:hypothetical protein n=1 Tax=Flavisphingomonas formosensis TaxID=861534 RepID=UPI0012F8FF4C|nr:hypothetical protein [Sphingomonas formosensis]
MARSLVLSGGFAVLTLLSACAPETPPKTAGPPPKAALPIAGLERVMGKDARSLMALFGTPDQDLREQSGARRLQFASSVCVLDAYLYPPGQGAEAVVTYVDARMPNGEDVDRASCVAALSRRKEAR